MTDTALPPNAAAWVAAQLPLIELVVGHVVRSGHWPRRSDLQREVMQPGGLGITVATIVHSMPRPVGHESDERIVLTLHALRETSAGRRLVDAFFLVLRIAVERYRLGSEPLRRSDLTGLGLSAPEELALGEIVLREAPFTGSGNGTYEDDWSREVSEAVARYQAIASPDDYLASRAAELAQHPQLGWATPPPPAPDPPGQPQPQSWLRGSALGLGVLLALTGLVPFFLGSPAWTIGAVLGVSAGTTVAGREGFFGWPPRARQIVTVLSFALVGLAAGLLAEAGDSEPTARDLAPGAGRRKVRRGDTPGAAMGPLADRSRAERHVLRASPGGT
jgi:hypothetical protein